MKEYAKLLTLYKHPFTLMRLGRHCDGGYVVPKELISNNLLTCGISNEISFEEDYIKHNDNVNLHAFDGTIFNFPSSNTIYNFHKINIDSADSANTISLNTIFDKYFAGQNEVFVKMDIEGWEYPSFDTISVENLSKIQCLVLEVHWIERDYDKFVRLMQILQQELVLIHRHDNNCGNYFNYENVKYADVYELTFINKKYLAELQVNDVQLPIQGLDFNNR